MDVLIFEIDADRIHPRGGWMRMSAAPHLGDTIDATVVTGENVSGVVKEVCWKKYGWVEEGKVAVPVVQIDPAAV